MAALAGCYAHKVQILSYHIQSTQLCMKFSELKYVCMCVYAN